MYIPPKHFILGLMTWGKDDDFDIFTYRLKKNCLAVNYLIVYIDEKCPNSYHYSIINMYTDIKSTLDKYDLNNSQEQGSSEGRL